MASPAAQAKAQALNAKLEGEARDAIDEIDKEFMRKIARQSHVCATRCYDKSGKSGASDELEMCVRNCQAPHQHANTLVQNVSLERCKDGRTVHLQRECVSPYVVCLLQEVNQYQNRLNRAMNECQDKARDLMQPGIENDARKMAKVEETLISCMSSTVDQHIKLLKPMRDRIKQGLK